MRFRQVAVGRVHGRVGREGADVFFEWGAGRGEGMCYLGDVVFVVLADEELAFRVVSAERE